MSETKEETALSVRPSDLLQVIARAATDPNIDVAKMEQLYRLHQEISADQRRIAFMAAMARLTPKLPEIGKHGTSHHGKYSRLEDIDRAIRPLIAAEGFSLSFDSTPMDGKVRVTCRLSHADGHSETKQIDLPLDNSGSKNGAQAVISTVSYGRRALTKMFFNLIETTSEDDDGNSGPGPLTEDQIKDLETLMSDAKADRKKFLEFMGAAAIEDIRQSDYAKAVNALQAKLRTKK